MQLFRNKINGNPNLYKGVRYLYFYLFWAMCVIHSMLILLFVISFHEGIFKESVLQENFLEREFIKFEGFFQLVIVYSGISLLSIIGFFSLFWDERKRNSRKLQRIFSNLKIINPVAIGIIVGVIIISIFYPSFRPLLELKEEAISKMEEKVLSDGDILDSSINNIDISSLKRYLDTDFNSTLYSQKVFSDSNELSTFSYPFMWKENGVNSYIFFEDAPQKKGNITGWIMKNRDNALQEKLGEKANIVAYLKKDDFSEMQDLVVPFFETQPNDKNCYNIKYRITYKNDEVDNGKKDNCSDRPEVQKGKVSPLRILVSDKEQKFAVESVEVWVTQVFNKPFQTSEIIPFRRFAVIEGTPISLFNINLCSEYIHPGMKEERFSIIAGNQKKKGYTVGSLSPVIHHECLSSIYKKE